MVINLGTFKVYFESFTGATKDMDNPLDLDQEMEPPLSVEFEVILKYFIELDSKDFIETKRNLFMNERESLIGNFQMIWNEVRALARFILKDIISLNQNYEDYIDYIEDIHLIYKQFDDSKNLREFDTFLSAINSKLGKITTLLSVSAIKFFVSTEITSGINKAYEQYKKIGEALARNSQISTICHQIKEFATDSSPSRYAAVVGPSFMGKTQLAFALSRNFKLIYVNLLSYLNVQSVYTSFSGISELFFLAIRDDEIKCQRTILSTSARELLHCKERLSILGLLEAILNFSPQEDQNWLDELIKLREMYVVRLTFDEFFEKISSVQLENFVLFIDEFPADYQLILFLRNIARVIRLPVVLAATNAKIGNMVGTSAAFVSREEGAKPWVKLITKLPKADPVFLAKFCEFKYGESIITLESILSVSVSESESDIDSESEIESDVVSVNFNVQSLMSFLRIICHQDEMDRIEILFKFLFDQARTCLPGIIFLIFQNLDRIIKDSVVEGRGNSSDDLPRRMWRKICELIYKEVHTRKKTMDSLKSFFLSGYIMSNHQEMASLYPALNENFRAATVDTHFYYLGTRKTPSIQDLVLLNSDLRVGTATNDNIEILENPPDEWKLHSYFSRFDEDIFIHFAAWGPAIYDNSTFYGICFKYNYSLTYVIEKISTTDFFVNSKSLKNNFKAQETLVTWAIGNASHLNVYGETGGVQFLREFAGHLQRIEAFDLLHPRDILNENDIPPRLISLLRRISVPYYVENSLNDMNPNFLSLISNFMNIGHLTRCFDKESTDIKFPIYFDGILKQASTECKYRDVATSVKFFSEYTEKAILKKYPFTMFVTNHVSKNFNFSGLSQDVCAALGIPHFNSNSYPPFKLNHYLISSEEESINQLVVTTLYEHDEFADGCALIITTNLYLPKS